MIRGFLTSNPRILIFTVAPSTNLTHIRLSISGKHPPLLRKMASSSSAPAAARKNFWDFKPADSILLHFFSICVHPLYPFGYNTDKL